MWTDRAFRLGLVLAAAVLTLADSGARSAAQAGGGRTPLALSRLRGLPNLHHVLGL